MPRTYDRIRAALREVASNETAKPPKQLAELSESLSRRKIPEFIIDRVQSRYLSYNALDRLFKFIQQLKLVRVDANNHITLTRRGQNALNPDNFDATLSTAVNDHLADSDVPMDDVRNAISHLTYPTTGAIFAKLQQTHPRLTDDKEQWLRKLLYLLHCTGRLTRQVNVFYVI